MAAFGDECGKPRRGFGNGIGRGDADDVEAFPPAVGDQSGSGGRRILDQKSRSA